MRRAWLLLATALPSCGEITRAELVVRPRKDDFEREIQPIFERLGCSAGTLCHSTPQGNLRLVVEPDAVQLEDNYQGTKSKIELDDASGSLLVADLLPDSVEPGANHVTTCWKSRDACAVRKLEAWIAWTSAEDARPQDIGCEVEVPGPDACDDPTVLDVCCFR
ncbi:hypothetical protein L6V77_25545 [Myxococcota bacterium]|nr:hypothetical protein [Myxococcota bacterium]